MKRSARFMFVLVFMCVTNTSAAAQARASATLAPDQQRLVLEEALTLYDEGIALRGEEQRAARSRFEESAARYELLVEAGVRNGRLFYNLANAQLQAGDVGHAIANYRRALRYMPGEPRIESNLEYARSQVEGRIAASGSRAVLDAISNVVAVVPWSWRLRGALAVYVLIWVLLAARLKWRRLVPRSLPWWCAAGCVLLAATVMAPQVLQRMVQEGVVIADDVIVRMGGGEGYEAKFAEPIHEGVEFSVIERRGEWMEIELPNGGRGWIRTEQAEIH